jgi:endonuclease-3
MARWGLSDGTSVAKTERDAKALFPKDKWNKLHIQIILYGREYSPARNPRLSVDYITRTIGNKKVLAGYKS